MHAAISAIRRLKRLVSLEVRAIRYLRIDVEPVTELRELRDLDVDIQILFDRRGRLLFPSLTGLTRLAVGDAIRSRKYRFSLNLQVRESLSTRRSL